MAFSYLLSFDQSGVNAFIIDQAFKSNVKLEKEDFIKSLTEAPTWKGSQQHQYSTWITIQYAKNIFKESFVFTVLVELGTRKTC